MDLILSFKIWNALQRQNLNHPLLKINSDRLLGAQPFITYAGPLWPYIVSRSIGREVESGHYDIIALSPVGQLGALWLMGAGVMHRQPLGVMFALVWLTRLVLIMAAFPLFYPLFVLIAITFLQQFEIVLGGLIGMIVPTYESSLSSRSLVAVCAHLILLGTAVGGAILALVLTISNMRNLLLPFVIALAVMTLLCHSIIVGLWRLLLYRTNATPEDVRFVLGD